MNSNGPFRLFHLRLWHGCGGQIEDWYETEREFKDRVPGWQGEGYSGYYELLEFSDVIAVVKKQYKVIRTEKIHSTVNW